MEAEEPLKDLADIHLPNAVSAWPPAPGWWFLAFLFIGACCAVGLLLFRRWQQRQRMRVALQELDTALTRWQQSPEQERSTQALQVLHTCNSVLKRVALVHYSPALVASLSGKAWLQFLDENGTPSAFSDGPAQILADGSYRRAWQADEATIKALLTQSQQWITQQYVRKPRPALTSQVQS